MARHLGVLTRWAEAQKTPHRMFAEVDVDGVRRTGLSLDDLRVMVERHRAALATMARTEALDAFADEIGLFRTLRDAYRVGVASTGLHQEPTDKK
jgi:hypothetical protein